MDKTEVRQRKPDRGSTKSAVRDPRVNRNAEEKSGRYFLCWGCCTILLLPCVILALYLYLTPCPIEPGSIQISDSFPEIPPEDKIQRIQSPERLRMIGAECIVVHEASRKVYTGLGNGMIVRFNLDLTEPTFLLRTGIAPFDDKYCAHITFQPDPKCGRPLGMRLLDEENLIVIDPFYGLFKINIVNLTKELILDFKKVGSDIMLGNDLVIMPDRNTIYFTDSSHQHGLQDFLYAFAELTPKGRLYRFTLDTRELTLVASGLYFSNGVELHRDGKSLLVAETPRARILKISLEDGRIDIFADNLIGIPDNIRRSPRGGYLVGHPSMRKWPFLSDFTAKYSMISTLIFKLLSTEMIIAAISPKESLFIRLGEDGSLLDMYYDEQAEHVMHISHAEEFEGFLYVGTFRFSYLLKIPVRS